MLISCKTIYKVQTIINYLASFLAGKLQCQRAKQNKHELSLSRRYWFQIAESMQCIMYKCMSSKVSDCTPPESVYYYCIVLVNALILKSCN